MPREIAHYTLVRLLPQVDAGEFANIGVLLACPKQGYFDFQLIKRYGRVTRFFEAFTNELFISVRHEVHAELRHIRDQVTTVGASDQENVVRVLHDLTKPRESMIRFAPLRLVLTSDPEAELNRLIERYVQPTLETVVQRHEALMTLHVSQLLKARWGRMFAPVQVGPAEFPVQLPLVYERNGKVLAAIKPLDLTQDEPAKIYEHGDLWIGKLRRLQHLKALPVEMLVPVEGPHVGDTQRRRAYDEVVKEFLHIGVKVTQASDKAQILEFAQGSRVVA